MADGAKLVIPDVERKDRNEIKRKPVGFFCNLQVDCVMAVWAGSRNFVFAQCFCECLASKKNEHVFTFLMLMNFYGIKKRTLKNS